MITDAILKRQCEESGWTCVARASGRLTVAMEATPAVQAVVTPSGSGVRVFAGLLEADAFVATGTACREAIEAVLGDASSVVHRVRAVTQENFGFEVNFPTLPSPEDLNEAFCCLSVACGLVGTELLALLDEHAAQDFLLVRGWAADASTPTPNKQGD
jgi:hypothetical protein